MDIKVLNQKDGIERILPLIAERKIIPIFGSGFTKDCKAHEGTVPDGEKATKIMQQLLLENNSDILKAEDLENMEFNLTAENFLQISKHSVKSKFFTDFFSEVCITGDKKDFLNFDWPYAYTLNIDDGIERTGLFKPVLPYKNFKNPNTSIRLLYKLHGDAFTEATNKSDKNIIFSSNQYIVSLTDETNRGILNNIEADYAGNNLLFVGCSLIYEPDLKFIYDKNKSGSDNNLRIFITNKNPETFKEKMNLISYGINMLILVDDYNLFYQNIVLEMRKYLSTAKVVSFKHKNPSIEKKYSKEDTIEYISGTSIFDMKKNTFYKGGMHIIRDVIKDIEYQLSIKNCVIVKGRRFSGKTFILATLCEIYKKYHIYYFPSSSLFDEQVINQLLNSCENSMFIFDSNSLSNDAYLLIANSGEMLIKNRNKVILASNSSDFFLSEMIDSGFIEINNLLSYDELKYLNQDADKYALNKRLKNHTNFDYLRYLSEEQKVKIPFLENYTCKLTDNEKKLLILLTVFDKVLIGDALALGVTLVEVRVFVNKFPKITELIETDKDEKNSHSSKKIVHNGKMLLLDKVNELSHDEIKNSIKDIVKTFKNDKLRRRLYVDTTMFDTLNQLFGRRAGAGHLIYIIYESLESELNGDLHYWLQRAKSIYRLRSSDKKQLCIAYSYAKKVYSDGYGKIYFQASLSLAIICGLLTKFDNVESDGAGYINEAIIYTHTALFSPFYKNNNRILKSELQIQKKKNNSFAQLKELCNNYIKKFEENTEKSDMVKRAIEIIKKLDEIALD